MKENKHTLLPVISLAVFLVVAATLPVAVFLAVSQESPTQTQTEAANPCPLYPPVIANPQFGIIGIGTTGDGWPILPINGKFVIKGYYFGCDWGKVMLVNLRDVQTGVSLAGPSGISLPIVDWYPRKITARQSIDPGKDEALAEIYVQDSRNNVSERVTVLISRYGGTQLIVTPTPTPYSPTPTPRPKKGR